MNTNTSIIIPDASALTVDTSCIDVSEVEVQEDKEFLLQKGENILRIVARAALEVGRELVEIQDHFKIEDGRGSGLGKYYGSIGISQYQAGCWANKYRAFCAYVGIFGEEGATEKLNGLGDQAAQRLWNLPRDYREAFLADIALGKTPNEDAISEVARRSEVKLTKAEELLEAAKRRAEAADKEWELAKADPDLSYKDQDYLKARGKNASAITSVNRYEERIAELTQQIEDERLAKESEIKAREQIEEKVEGLKDELLKYDQDDTSIREARMRRVSNALIATLPNVYADVQRFYTEIEHYDPDTVMFLEEHIKLLKSYVESHL